MFVRLSSHTAVSPRSGSLLPGIAIAILVCGGCMALVLNEYWLSAAQEELRTATQSAALAAAQKLASDETLKPDYDSEQLAEQVREAALEQARKNFVQGRVPPEVDVHLARVTLDPSTGQTHSLETDNSPNSVVVIGHRDRSRNNPVALLAPVLTGRPDANVTVNVEASVTNLIEGVRPFGGVDVPAWPMAILQSSPDSDIQTWESEIEQRQGTDTFRWNAETQKVESGRDGLPEIMLQPVAADGKSNLLLIDIGSHFRDEELLRQFTDGWSTTDLNEFGEVFSFKPGPLDLAASQDFLGTPYDTLKKQIGKVRIMLLYTTVKVGGNGDLSAQVVRMVAGRLMDVTMGTDGPVMIVQAGVVATRTAVLDEDALYAGETRGNPYIYKISITQ